MQWQQSVVFSDKADFFEAVASYAHALPLWHRVQPPTCVHHAAVCDFSRPGLSPLDQDGHGGSLVRHGGDSCQPSTLNPPTAHK
jgi:hypothetical protein